MEVLYPRCAGLDVHKKTVVAHRLSLDEAGKKVETRRTFSTVVAGLLDLSDWLQEAGITHVAMESTGVYWKPVYNILEGQFELLVVNAAHVKNVPGCKTDPKDAAWLAELLQHGLVRGSFVPPVEQRDLRDMTRHRSGFVRARSTLVNRIHKLLECANIKLGSVATDVMGVSGRNMLDAMVAGDADPTALALLARGRLRSKSQELVLALEGRMKAHHRMILRLLLTQIDTIDDGIEQLDAAIESVCAPIEETVAHLDTIPGVGREIAQIIVAEVGTDMSRFASAAQLAAWGGPAPGNNQSGGKRLPSKRRKGNQSLLTALVNGAHAAVKMKGTYLHARYHRVAARRGHKRAIMAVAHDILVISYYLIKRQEDYKELGGDYFDQRQPESTAKRLVSRLQALGYDVSATKTPDAVQAA